MLNVQQDLIARLSEALGGVEVHARRPSPSPSEVVTVTREGGGRDNRVVDSPGVGVYCWAPTEKRACELAEEVDAAVRELEFADGYAAVGLESMRSDPDPDSMSPRWYLSYTMKTIDPVNR